MRTQTLKLRETTLHIVEAGDPEKPAIVFLHGFPDCHDVWQAQMDALSDDYHVISFDMRGAGKSTPPSGSQGYRVPRLLHDIEQVINHVRGPQSQVHLVGHDWGSIIGWSFVSDPAYSPRVLSWTSLSGPHMGVGMNWAFDTLINGNRDTRVAAASQIAHSWYMMVLNVPGAGRTVFALLPKQFWKATMQLGGIPADSEHMNRSRQEARSLTSNTFRLYQQNVLTPPTVPPLESVRVPSQIVILDEDAFVRPEVCQRMAAYCTNSRQIHIKANHWAPVSNPESVTKTIREFVSWH